MKMEPIEGSETSVFKPQTPGKYPKENIIRVLSYLQQKEGILCGQVTSFVGVALKKHVIKGMIRGTIRRGIRCKQYIALCGEIPSEEAMDES